MLEDSNSENLGPIALLMPRRQCRFFMVCRAARRTLWTHYVNTTWLFSL